LAAKGPTVIFALDSVLGRDAFHLHFLDIATRREYPYQVLGDIDS